MFRRIQPLWKINADEKNQNFVYFILENNMFCETGTLLFL